MSVAVCLLPVLTLFTHRSFVVFSVVPLVFSVTPNALPVLNVQWPVQIETFFFTTRLKPAIIIADAVFGVYLCTGL